MRGTSRVLAGLLIAAAIAGQAQAAQQDAGPQKMVVFFEEWSAALDSDAANVINHAAEVAKSAQGKHVTVTGYADTTGSEAANRLLSDLRAQVVTDKLVEDGVPADAIKQAGKGEVASDVYKQESRRVGISVE